MEINPKLIKLVVSLFVCALILYNFIQIIRGEHIIINILGILICVGGYIVYNKFANNDDKDQF